MHYSKSKNKVFHVGSILPITKSNAKIFFRAAEAMCELGFCVSVLAEGDNESRERLFEFADKYENFEVFEDLGNENRNKILTRSDVALFLSEPDSETMNEVLSRGIVPIIPESRDFKNFDPQTESGDSFIFEENNFWQLASAIIRASENFKFSYDWNNLKKNVLEKVEERKMLGV